MTATDADAKAILAKRRHNGGDYWATPDGRLYVGSPFSTLSSLLMLYELGVPAKHEAVSGGLELTLEACRDDGKIRLAPTAPLYPCYTAEAARVLCRFGLARDKRVCSSTCTLSRSSIAPGATGGFATPWARCKAS